MTTLLKNVLICDGSMDRGRCGSVLVADGKIAALLPPESGEKADETVDGRGRMALIPGFVNAHSHAAMSLLRGIGEEAPLMEWLQTKIWPVEAKLRKEHVLWGTRLALLEMVSGGTTAFGDMYFEMDAVVEASLEAGVRCAPCRGIVGDERWKFDDGLRLAETWKEHGDFVSVQLGPHAPYTVPLPLMKEITAEAAARGLAVHVHFLETEWELGYLKDEFGMTPAEYLEASGILEAPGALLAHCVWLSPEDLAGLNLDALSIAHNPNSNLKLGSGVMDLPGLLGRTDRIALGTDGAASN
ncbi:MAG TPA: amidohydrolase, partial [Synergistaceae bacterium]|nr:amidohydrolase [Synergistaceae bacterium]